MLKMWDQTSDTLFESNRRYTASMIKKHFLNNQIHHHTCTREILPQHQSPQHFPQCLSALSPRISKTLLYILY